MPHWIEYKYNPALIIAGAVNDRVVVASDGQVIGVDTTRRNRTDGDHWAGETAIRPSTDSSRNWKCQPVIMSARGDTIGYLAEPTKYYSVEGANLYFAMTKEGKPVNPMDYIR